MRNMRSLTLLGLLLSIFWTVQSQERIFLYPASAEGVQIKGFDTTAPYMDHYPAMNGTGSKTAVLICPGGGYTHLAFDKEGVLPARFFNAQGMDAFVLRYRLNNSKQEGHRFPDQYRDVTTAIRIIRSGAAGWQIDPEKVGIMGFSAGGHLAASLATILQKGNPDAPDPLERIATRPAFAILIYPVITMDTQYTHRGSRNMLLGLSPDEFMVNALSTDKRVSASTPPVFLIHADDDKVVVPQNSILFYEALKRNHVPAAMTIYDHGGHGFGMAPEDPLLSQWPLQILGWLNRLGYK